MSPEAVPSAARGVLRVFGDYSFADPWFLALLPLAPLLYLWGRRRRARARAGLPAIAGMADGLPRSMRQRFLWLPGLLQVLGVAAAVVALARPLRGNVQQDLVSEGVDIVLALDRSGSMAAPDLEEGRTRLDVVKEVVGAFAERRMTDREGAADNVALLTFARYPRLLCPFTLDAGALTGFLEGVELARAQGEDGTAIGVALAKAVALLRESDAKSRVVVLLTDGQNNVTDIQPRAAAELAAELGIRVYTVFAARFVCEISPVLSRWVATDAEPDTSELEAIAEVTGGRFYRARDQASLEQIYEEIEALERTPRREVRYEEAYDLYPWFLLPATLAYALAWLSHATWGRRGP